MKKLIAILSVVLFANQMSAEELRLICDFELSKTGTNKEKISDHTEEFFFDLKYVANFFNKAFETSFELWNAQDVTCDSSKDDPNHIVFADDKELTAFCGEQVLKINRYSGLIDGGFKCKLCDAHTFYKIAGSCKKLKPQF